MLVLTIFVAVLVSGILYELYLFNKDVKACKLKRKYLNYKVPFDTMVTNSKWYNDMIAIGKYPSYQTRLAGSLMVAEKCATIKADW